MNISKMRCLVENYYTNLTMLTELQNKVSYETTITANYELDSGGASGFSNSKTENQAMKVYGQNGKIEKIENNIKIVDESIKILDQNEREVIELVKVHRNKLSRIARKIHKSTKYVFDIRKRALKKMCEFVGGGE